MATTMAAAAVVARGAWQVGGAWAVQCSQGAYSNDVMMIMTCNNAWIRYGDEECLLFHTHTTTSLTLSPFSWRYVRPPSPQFLKSDCWSTSTTVELKNRFCCLFKRSITVVIGNTRRRFAHTSSSLYRSSQPLVGMTNKSCGEDEKLLNLYRLLGHTSDIRWGDLGDHTFLHPYNCSVWCGARIQRLCVFVTWRNRVLTTVLCYVHPLFQSFIAR